MNENPIKATLITKGRKTGKDHAVMLSAVYYNGKYYFSRHRPDSDWYQNAIYNNNVRIKVSGKTFGGTAKKVDDEKMLEKISHLKYPGQKRSQEKRVAIEVTPHE